MLNAPWPSVRGQRDLRALQAMCPFFPILMWLPLSASGLQSRRSRGDWVCQGRQRRFGASDVMRSRTLWVAYLVAFERRDAWLFLKSDKPLPNAPNPSARPYVIPFLVIWSSRRRFAWDNLT